MSTSTDATELDLQQVVGRLADHGLADAVLPHLERALASLAAERGPDAPIELSDVLVRLVAIGEPDAVLPLLAEVEALTRHPDAPPPPPAPIDPRAYPAERERAIVAQLGAPGAVPYGSAWGRLDERVVEYPWVFDRLGHVHPPGGRVLDAGSVLNHASILEHWRAARLGPLSIVTLHHEGVAWVSDDVRYEFADLRRLPYRDAWFDSVVCLSTLEHVGMDNALYGDDLVRADDAAGALVAAVGELRRVLRPGGRLLVSVPCGAASDRGWLRILDVAEVAAMSRLPGWSDVATRFFRATPDGWIETGPDGVRDAGYNEVRGGPRSAPRWVAAAEAVALLELTAAPAERPSGSSSA